jgi:hypothetical protein
MTAPVPIGVTASFNAVGKNVATGNFSFSEAGIATITFQPVDVNNPGVATLYDSTNNVIQTISAEGYETFQLPLGGGTYYFKATLGANILAATLPSIGR